MTENDKLLVITACSACYLAGAVSSTILSIGIFVALMLIVHFFLKEGA